MELLIVEARRPKHNGRASAARLAVLHRIRIKGFGSMLVFFGGVRRQNDKVAALPRRPGVARNGCALRLRRIRDFPGFAQKLRASGRQILNVSPGR
jgi:hypothetical protein